MNTEQLADRITRLSDATGLPRKHLEAASLPLFVALEQAVERDRINSEEYELALTKARIDLNVNRWWQVPSELAAFLSWLTNRGESWTAKQVIDVVEKPQNWQDEFNEWKAGAPL